jgi:dTDP-4-amino-4,6-dideoxygalactose transaminase
MSLTLAPATLRIPAEGTARRRRALAQDITTIWARLLISPHSLIRGEYAAAFEHAICATWDVDTALGTSSGTSALHIALLASGIGPGNYVGIPTHTFYSTAEAVCMTGATPVFIDIEPMTYTLDPKCAREAYKKYPLKAIIPVHLYGQPCNMDALLSFARLYNITVIEDASQAHGARYHGHYVGSLGAFGCFSLYEGKNIGGLGDAGLITVANETPGMAKQLWRLHDLGRVPENRYEHTIHGLRARMREEDAAVALVQLGYLDKWNARRAHIAARYTEAFARLPVILPFVAEHVESAWYKYVMLVSDGVERARLAQHLREWGIGTEHLYPMPLCDQPVFRDKYPVMGKQVAVQVCERVVGLPIYPELTEDEIGQVIACVKRFYE